MQERTLKGAQAGENTDIFTTLQIFERFWKIGSWLTDSEPNNEPNFSIMHIFYDFSFKSKTSDMKSKSRWSGTVETLFSIVDWLAWHKRKDFEKIKRLLPLGSLLLGGLGWEAFFIHSNGDLAGPGLEDPRGDGDGQSSSRLDPMLILGGAPADTEGEEGRPRSEEEQGGSCLYCWMSGAPEAGGGDKEGL